MTNSWMEWAIIGFIVLAIAWIVWRGGAANPESTGSISRKVGDLDTTIGKLGTRVEHVEKDLEELKAEAATTKDIARLEERIAGVTTLVERTARGVDRIERMFIEKGVNGK